MKLSDKERYSIIWNQYQNGLNYLSSTKLRTSIPVYVDFYEGRQWAPETEETKDLPRPMINIIKMICRSKKSGVLGTPVKINYKADNNTDVSKFNHFAEYIAKEIKLEDADARAISDAVKKGTYIYHFYWDSEAKGMTGRAKGGVRVENIDPLNIVFSNPNEPDEQKQKWIIIASREELEAVREIADKGINKEDIVADERNSTYMETEQEGTEYVTVLTRYFKKDGEVWFEKSVHSSMVTKARSLTPDVEGALKALKSSGEDEANVPIPDTPEKSKTMRIEKPVFEYYPIVVGSWEERDKSIYGIGEVEGLVPNQQSINFKLAMFDKAIEDQVMPMIVKRPGAIEDEITNESGQQIEDLSPDFNGIKYLTPPTLPKDAITYVDKLIELTRVVTGATEVMSGEVISGQMSGAAIAQLQSQANKPLEELRDRFWRVKEKQGKVLEYFFKLFYEQEEFPYTHRINGEDITEFDIFNGSEFSELPMSIVTEAGAATRYSEVGDIQVLETMLNGGHIDAEGFIRAYPNNALGNKQLLIESIQKVKQDQLKMVTSQLEQANGQLQQAAKYIQEQEKIIDSVPSIIRENKQLKEMLADITSEATEKINMANAAILERQADAEALATELAAFKGLNINRKGNSNE